MTRTVELRRARPEESVILLQWANDPETRRQSFRTDPIALEEHRRWFAEKIREPHVLFLIGMDQDTAVGTLRFEPDGDAALVNITIDPFRRGRGYGSDLLRAGVRFAVEQDYARRFRALVKATNVHSMKCFFNAGFSKVGEQFVAGIPVVVLSHGPATD